MLLALDTSSDFGALALVEPSTGRVQAELGADVPTKHETTLLGRIDALLGLGGIGKRDLTALAVGTGPGGFTSVRVGLATVKGLALALDLPVVGVSSLLALARSVAPASGLVATVVDAHRGELFGAMYLVEGAGTLALATPFAGAPADVAEALRRCAAGMRFIAAGDGLVKHPGLLDALGEDVVTLPHARIRASALGAYAAHRLATHGADDAGALVPEYVRPSDAKLPDMPLDTAHVTK